MSCVRWCASHVNNQQYDTLNASASRDGKPAATAGRFNVVAQGSAFIVGTLQPFIAAHPTDRLIIEENARTPAFHLDSGSDARRTPDGESGAAATKPDGNHARRLGEIDAEHAACPIGLQFKEIQTAQFGSHVRAAALEHDLPGDGGAECDLRCALLCARNPQASWIADSNHAIFNLHIWHGAFEAGLVEYT